MRVLIWVYVATSVYNCGAPAPAPPSCRELVDAEQWAAALPRCSVAYDGSRDPRSGLGAARAAYYLQKCEAAERFARALIPGPEAANAEFVLGGCALMQRELDTARDHLQRAMAMHEQDGKLAEQARDAHQLAGVWFARGEYLKGFEALKVARDAAVRASDARMQVYVDIAASDFHRAVGDRRTAEQEIGRAVAEARDPGTLATAHLKEGIFQIEAGLLGPAQSTFERALIEERRLQMPRPQHVVGALLNLAYLDRKAGTADGLARALERVEEAHRLEGDEMSYRLNRGMVLAELGRLAEATADLRAAEAAGPTGEWSWWVPYQAALVATKAGDLQGAIEACGRSIAKVTELA
ncbi:MAG TPA: hypothetical protein VN253_08880, partial [Kofleriaceae bacterium]|nr:hypothetical protein [Kofleriaceae bacterium]